MISQDILHNQHQPSTQDRNDGGRVHLLTPFQHQLLQKSLQDDLPEPYRQRIQIMLMADEGKTQTEICQTLGCCPGTARHWILMARSGMAHRWQDSPIGRPKAVNDKYLERLKELVSQSPREFGYGFERWTGQWLSKHLAKEFGIKLGDRRINQLLKEMGLSTREQPAKAENATHEDTTSTNLKISDLLFSSAPDVPDLWSKNFGF
ncbi:MAG: helix-turn-helix domain-containing protein [Calothrix sp. MO_192.B10]|nr:helix-turn-helix domain-containing protein [Calothrix sp. MO_192.B10]